MKLVFLFSILFVNPCFAAVKVDVDISSKTMYVYENGKQLYKWRVNTAMRGYKTRTGNFGVLFIDIDHKSSKYPKPNGGAPMNYAIFYSGDYAIHQGSVTDAGSHGCIRLEGPKC